MVENSDNNVKQSMGLNAKLTIMGLGLVILFLLIYIYVSVQPKSQSSQVIQADDPASSTVSDISSDKVTAVSDLNNPVIQISTDLGNLKIELYPDYAPVVVRKLIKLIGENYYRQGVVLDSKPGIGFVIAKVSADAHHFDVTDDEVNNLRSERGSVAILKHNVSPAYLNNIFVGYKSQLELQENYIILGHVLEGVADVEKNSVGKTGTVSAVSVIREHMSDDGQMSSSW